MQIENGFASRHKVDPQLLERYEWDSRYNGARNIKNELSTARRTATSISSSISKFNHLKVEDRQALESAAKAIRKLANDLTTLSEWAREYYLFCERKRVEKDTEELELIAGERWGGDKMKMLFEADLISELASEKGRHSFAEWMHRNSDQRDVQPHKFSSVFRSPGPLNKSGCTDVQFRLALAKLIQEAKGESSSRFDGYGGVCYFFGWAEYEKYLTYRQEVCATTRRILSSVNR